MGPHRKLETAVTRCSSSIAGRCRTTTRFCQGRQNFEVSVPAHERLVGQVLGELPVDRTAAVGEQVRELAQRVSELVGVRPAAGVSRAAWASETETDMA